MSGSEVEAQEAVRPLPDFGIGAYTLTSLAQEFRPALVRYFSRRIRQKDEVEDLVQEVLARLVRRGEVVEMEAVRAYVFETASSVLTDWGRRRRSRRVDDHGVLSIDHPSAGDFAADRILLGRERLRSVTAALLELPERPRSVFILRRVEGMKYQDIAWRLGLSLSSVEKDMRRAVLHLAERMDRE